MLRKDWWGGGDGAFAGGGMSTIFRDVLLNGMAALAGLAIILLAAVNVPGDQAKKDTVPPGNITVEIYWPKEHDTDVDLWVRGPTGQPVGYSNKGGEHYNLLRDDMGNTNEDDPINYEVTYSRGIPVGRHCVNLHLYSNSSGVLPISVKVTIKISKGNAGSDAKGGGTPVLISDVQLPTKGKEVNVFCFKTDENGDMVKGKNAVFQSDAICLRSPTGC